MRDLQNNYVMEIMRDLQNNYVIEIMRDLQNNYVVKLRREPVGGHNEPPTIKSPETLQITFSEEIIQNNFFIINHNLQNIKQYNLCKYK